MTRQHACEVLGLASVASEREIIKAHRALIKKHHPDRGGSTARAALINQAKDTLLERRR
jgi:curved DNA-binding protein CbpA